MYLSEYGYLSPRVRNPQSGHLMSEETMTKAIMEFQAFASLNLTGMCNLNFMYIYLDNENTFFHFFKCSLFVKQFT